MSDVGIKKFASILSAMEESRIKLFSGDKQDIRLGKLLEKMNDLAKDDFCRITMETNGLDGVTEYTKK